MAVNKTTKKKQNKDERICLRCEPSQKRKLKKDADELNMSLTDYLLECANTYKKNKNIENKKSNKLQTNTANIELNTVVSNTFWRVKNWENTHGTYEELLAILEKGMEESWNLLPVH